MKRIPILILCNECRKNVFEQYPKFSIDKKASWMAWLCNYVYDKQEVTK